MTYWDEQKLNFVLRQYKTRYQLQRGNRAAYDAASRRFPELMNKYYPDMTNHLFQLSFKQRPNMHYFCWANNAKSINKSVKDFPKSLDPYIAHIWELDIDVRTLFLKLVEMGSPVYDVRRAAKYYTPFQLSIAHASINEHLIREIAIFDME